MAGFGQTFQGDWEKFRKILQKTATLNLKKMHTQIGETLAANTDLRFMDQKGPDGTPWPKNQRGGQILDQKGTLRGSVTYVATEKQVEIGTNLKYGAIHQFGGTIQAKRKKYLKFKTAKGWVQKKKIRIPARPFIGFSEEDRLDILSLYQKTLKEAAK